MDHDQGGEAVQEDPAGAGRQARPPGQQRLRRGRFKYLKLNFESRAKDACNGVIDFYYEFCCLKSQYIFQVNTIFTSTGKKFWETNPTETWDMINGYKFEISKITSL